jgi:signal transduction histidine kinase
MKSRLMTMISHELRTPLTYIYGYVNLLQEEHAELSVDERQEMITAIQRGAERLARLVEDLLLVARLESGEIALEIQSGCETIQLDALVREAVNSKALVSEERGTVIEARIPTEMTLSCEPTHLRNALARLIDNAIKFTQSPGGHVWITAAQEDEMVRIGVQDDGIGVSADKQKLLFQPLQQIDREQHEQQGIGIGLAIAHGIVTAHGGHIEVTSEGIPGQGSIFMMVFPQNKQLLARTNNFGID